MYPLLYLVSCWTLVGASFLVGLQQDNDLSMISSSLIAQQTARDNADRVHQGIPKPLSTYCQVLTQVHL